MVGVLREGTDGETRRPQPTLADLPTLVEESRAAGMRIEAELDLPAEGRRLGRTHRLPGRPGAELHLSVATVKAHVSRLLEKLGADNRVQIALLVRDASPPGVPR